MRRLVNAGLKSAEEFAIRLMRGEVFHCHVSEGITWSYRCTKHSQFMAKSSSSMYYEHFSPLNMSSDILEKLMVEQELTLADLIKIKRRLCHVADHQLDKHKSRRARLLV